jgi:hypothetical protein
MFEPKRAKAAGGRRTLLNEEPANLYSPSHVITMIKSKTMRWARHVELMGRMRIAYKIFVGKTGWKRTLARPGHRWVDT